MKKHLPGLFIALCISFSAFAQQTGQLLVKPSASVIAASADEKDLLRWMIYNSAYAIKRQDTYIHIHVKSVVKARHSHAFDNLFLLTVIPAEAAPKVAQLLNVAGNLDMIQEIPSATIAAVPNDPHFNRQWALLNTGSGQSPLTAKPGADINISQAWDITTGDTGVIVAVIDAGINLNHPELRDRIWINRNEIPGNNLDDDGNDYEDDVYGYNMAYQNNNPMDDNGHGTMVAGVIGADGDNNTGFTGMDWKCRIMALKATDSTGFANYLSLIEGIVYAVDNGAQVINMSVSGYSPFAYLDTAVKYAADNNVLIAACSGNNDVSFKPYPASIEPVIAVGSTNPDDTRSAPFTILFNGKDTVAGGSNYGSYLDIVAPGNYIYVLNHKDTADYQKYNSGTSFASPMVAATAALIKAKYPSHNYMQIRNMILSSADDQVGDASEDIAGRDNFYGYGRLNVYNALNATPTGISQVQYNKGFSIYPNPVQGGGNIYFEEAPAEATLNIYDLAGKLVYADQQQKPGNTISFSTTALPAGSYIMQVKTPAGLFTQKLVVSN